MYLFDALEILGGLSARPLSGSNQGDLLGNSQRWNCIHFLIILSFYQFHLIRKILFLFLTDYFQGVPVSPVIGDWAFWASVLQ